MNRHRVIVINPEIEGQMCSECEAKLNVREDTEGMSESIFHPRRVLAVLVVITVLLAAVAAFLSSTGESTKYSPGTPEGVFNFI